MGNKHSCTAVIAALYAPTWLAASFLGWGGEFFFFLHLCGGAPHARRCKLKVPFDNCRRGGDSSTLIAAAKQGHRMARPYHDSVAPEIGRQLLRVIQ